MFFLPIADEISFFRSLGDTLSDFLALPAIAQCEDSSRMSVLTSEAVVLRTWPVNEAD